MSNSFFNSLDYFCILLMLISCLVGFFRGFIRDFFNTCSWVGSGFVTAFVSPYIAHQFQENGTVSNPTLAKIAAIILSFVIVLVTLLITVSAISKIVKGSFFSGLDRAFGALYGFVRGFIILVVLYVGIMMFDLFNHNSKIIADSKIIPHIMVVVDYIMPKTIDVPKLKKKISQKKSEWEFTEEDLRKMDRFVNEYAYKKEKQTQTESKISRLKKIENYLDELVSKIFVKDSSSSTGHRSLEQRTKITKSKYNNEEFGCMDLMKARAKRRAQKKAERLKKDLLKRLDRRPE